MTDFIAKVPLNIYIYKCPYMVFIFAITDYVCFALEQLQITRDVQ